MALEHGREAGSLHAVKQDLTTFFRKDIRYVVVNNAPTSWVLNLIFVSIAQGCLRLPVTVFIRHSDFGKDVAVVDSMESREGLPFL